MTIFVKELPMDLHKARSEFRKNLETILKSLYCNSRFLYSVLTYINIIFLVPGSESLMPRLNAPGQANPNWIQF